MKFKIGDRVTVVRANFNNEDELRWEGFILSITQQIAPIKVDMGPSRANGPYGYLEDCLELSIILESPLYKALS